MAMLVDAAIDTTPAAMDLVTPPNRPDTGPSGSPTAASRASYTLREGVGSRRLSKFRCKAAIQLLLVQVRAQPGLARGITCCMPGRRAPCAGWPLALLQHAVQHKVRNTILAVSSVQAGAGRTRPPTSTCPDRPAVCATCRPAARCTQRSTPTCRPQQPGRCCQRWTPCPHTPGRWTLTGTCGGAWPWHRRRTGEGSGATVVWCDAVWCGGLTGLL